MFVQRLSSVQRLSLNSNDDVQPEEVEVVEDDTEDNE